MKQSIISVFFLALVIAGFAQSGKKPVQPPKGTIVVASDKLATDKPNILVIWGDDIGWQNISAYGMGTMGYTTPNIDRIGKEGAIFTDHYAQPSCTAGRAAFITGQYPIRSGMTTVGSPGDALGLQPGSPCLAEVLKVQGYATGHFGKNHLGDRNIHLPTAHGFDEFYGNLYHLNTQEESEQRDYKNEAKKYPGGAEAYEKKFGTRAIIHSWATDTDDETVQPRWGKVGKQKITEDGPLTQKRMELFDSAEVAPKAMDFMLKAKKNGKPFFVWLNTSRMHLYTRLNEHWRYAAEKYTSEADYYGSGLLQHDADVKTILDFLEKNGLAENTVVWYSTDNGPEHSSWPHGGTTPFRGEKMSTFEGGVRVISMVRWPGHIKSGTVLNGIQSHMDMFTTFAAMAGVKNVAADMLAQKKQYIDGVNNLDYWTGKTNESKREDLFYYYESKLMAIRMNQWKVHFNLKEDYYGDVQPRTAPLVFNIRMDPNESYDNSDSYGHLLQKVSWIFAPMGEKIGLHVKTLLEYPPVQGAKSFDMSNIIESIKLPLQ
jgi:arylsulfatase A-like enzyme